MSYDASTVCSRHDPFSVLTWNLLAGFPVSPICMSCLHYKGESIPCKSSNLVRWIQQLCSKCHIYITFGSLIV
uniref:Uncharacterized protein n=1 Tax=Populus trichocarpa TaxID=3694 RepID=U5G243_POPTR